MTNSPVFWKNLHSFFDLRCTLAPKPALPLPLPRPRPLPRPAALLAACTSLTTPTSSSSRAFFSASCRLSRLALRCCRNASETRLPFFVRTYATPEWVARFGVEPSGLGELGTGAMEEPEKQERWAS